MRQSLRDKIIQICDEKIAKKGDAVGVSFYAFFMMILCNLWKQRNGGLKPIN